MNMNATQAFRSGCLLIVDDDEDVLTTASFALDPYFIEMRTLRFPALVERALADGDVEAMLLDMNFAAGISSGREGLQWLARVRDIDPTLSVVLMTAYGEISLAIEALKAGATDFVLKPWQNDKLVATMSAAAALTRARREAGRLKLCNETLTSGANSGAQELIGSSPRLRETLSVVRRAAPTDANVLILGESGTGKELTAREIHRLSNRNVQPFVSVDLGSVSETLFESELFGHKRGAFTGADRDRAGRVQAAHCGTLFLDEIGNLPIYLQGKLLTLIERREVTPVGASRPISVNVRLICATNCPLEDLEREGRFRQDLLFRIKTIEITLPPLRERLGDIPLLAERFLEFYSRKNNLERRRISADALEMLESYGWPGNVRELRHMIERAVVLSSEPLLRKEDFLLPSRTAKRTGGEDGFDLIRSERDTIQRALAHFGGNISLAADALGLSRAALYRRIAKHDL